MTAPETRAVFSALASYGSARFVGGCVRDAWLGRPVQDIDIATSIIPEHVVELLERAGIKVGIIGLAHGTITAIVGEWRIEITTLRHDVETDGRHASVAFTADWQVDASRRDFTINAIYCDADGTLYDPVRGLTDLQAGRVKFIGDASTRISEDALRILRYFRFYAYFGRCEPDVEGLDACRSAAEDLRGLSGNRIVSEVFQLLAAPGSIKALKLMKERDILAVILPEVVSLQCLQGLIGIEDKPDPERRLAALLSEASNSSAVADRLQLSKQQRERLQLLTKPSMVLTESPTEKYVRRILYRLGPSRFSDLVLLHVARFGGFEGWQKLLDVAESWVHPLLPVKGADVVAMGIKPGPSVGRLIKVIEYWWEEETDFRADRGECLKKLGTLVSKERV
tara:strand:- start:320 stop:1507 length:1188 start_codon:yes stop_codon:yes gene_type:complete